MPSAFQMHTAFSALRQREALSGRLLALDAETRMDSLLVVRRTQDVLFALEDVLAEQACVEAEEATRPVT